MPKTVKSETKASDVHFIKRDKKKNIVGDYVVAQGHSVLTKVGQKNEGQPMLAKYLANGDADLEKLITSKVVCKAKEAKK